MCIKSRAWINGPQCCATTFLFLPKTFNVLEFPSLNITPGIITMWDQLGYEKTCTNIHIIYVLSDYKM